MGDNAPKIEAKRQYEAPKLTELGTLHDLTLQLKEVGEADGIILVPNTPLVDVSP